MTPWPLRDDLPVVLVTLDGLGDRPCGALAGRTPAEAARTPVLDELTRRGAAGVHVPFGPGWATSSERSHWAMFGLNHVGFPGRAALELLGVGGRPPRSTPMWHLAIRQGKRTGDGAVRITGRLARDRHDVSAAAQEALSEYCSSFTSADIRFEIVPLRVGEWVLIAHGAQSQEISDTDPLFEHLHPWMRPLALREAADAGGARAAQAQRTATAMEEFLLGARESLQRNGIEYDVPTTKWASRIEESVVFRDEVGVEAAMVTSSALYRGLARYLGAHERDVAAAADDPALGLDARVAAALDLLDAHDPDARDLDARDGGDAARIDFLHVHTKAPDEAGHTKDPVAKIAAIEACDAALAPLVDRLDRKPFVLAVTGDHATPSETMLLHSGDPTPFAVAGPEVRVDPVSEFGESAMLSGSLGRLRAEDIAPLLHGLARRPFFLGHRPGRIISAAMPVLPPAMPDHAPDLPSIPPPTLEESHA